jgi:TRAP-type uncharacterized transport system substrate-binding protein
MSENRWSEPSLAEGEPIRVAVADRGAPEWYFAAVLRRLAADAGVNIQSKRFDGGEARRVASIHEGMAEVCIAPEETVRWAYRAEAAYDGWRHTSFRLLAGIEQAQWLAVAARADLHLASLDELAGVRGLRMLTYVPGGESATWSFVVRELLAAHGVGDENVRLLDFELERTRVRRLDFDLIVAPLGAFRGWRSAIWQEAAALTPLRFLPLGAAALARLEGHGLRRRLLPADELPGLEEPVETVGFDRWLVFCSERLEDETALALVRALDEGRDRLAPLHAFHDARRPLLDVGVPVHRAVRQERDERGLERVPATAP